MLLDAHGKTILATGVKGGINSLDITNLPTGIYTLMVQWENNRAFKKVVVY